MKKSLLLAGMILAAQQNNAFAAAGYEISDLTETDGLIARAAAAFPGGDDGEEVSSKPMGDEEYALLVAAGIEGEGEISDREFRRALRHQQKLESLLGIGGQKELENPLGRGDRKRARDKENLRESASKVGRVALGNSRLTNTLSPSTGLEFDKSSLGSIFHAARVIDSEDSDCLELSAAKALLILSVSHPWA